MIEEIDVELAKAIKDFMRAVDVEALRLVKRVVSTYCLNLATVHSE